jgi:hypothetical protein
VAATERGPVRRRATRAAWALVALALASLARADERVAIDGHLYLDSDRLEVWHPHAGVQIDLDEELAVAASYDADVISAATIDVRTAASPRGFVESRHGLGVDLTAAPSSTLRYGVSASGSFAPDYASGTASARLAWEDDTRTHTVAVAASGSYAGVGRVGDQAPVGDAWAGGASVAWTAVVSRAMVLDLALAGEHARGYLESPYRFVTIHDALDPTGSVVVPESLPDARTRGSARARIRIAPTDDLFVRGSYRFHADDWGVAGHTVSVEAAAAPVPELLASLELRCLVQRGASFYRGRYETLPDVPTLRARDRELAPTTTLGAALRLETRFAGPWNGEARLFLRGELLYTRLVDTPLLPERLAGVVGLGLSFER